VRSIDRNLITKTGKNYIRKGKVLAFNINKVGLPYKRVKLSKDGNASLHLVSRLVLTAFVGHPKQKEQACHNNSDPSDNKLENLRWDSAKGNYKDRIENATYPVGTKNPNRKLKEKDVLFIRNSTLSQKKLGELFGVSPKYIYNIRSRRTWHHV